MTTRKNKKLQYLFAIWPKRTVATMAWLEREGISRFLKQNYIRSEWIKPIGIGAYIRCGDAVDWEGGLYALQSQLGLEVHLGSKSALHLWGMAHFLNLGPQLPPAHLICSTSTHLPKWFLSYKWSSKMEVKHTNFLPANLGIVHFNMGSFLLYISCPERAALEVLLQTPQSVSYHEINLLFENFVTLRPQVVESLLMACNNNRVKRLFMYLAVKHNYPWLKSINLKNISLGKSVISLEKGGIYNKEFNIVLPKELANDEEHPIF